MGKFVQISTTLVVLVLVLAISASTDDVHRDSPSNSIFKLRSLSTFNMKDAIGLVFIALGLAISAAGGVGGGTIIVPVLVLIMNFDIKLATPVSNLAIVGGAVANAGFNIRKRHPAVDRPLIDSDLALSMIPLVMGGAVVGTVLSKLLPSYLLSLLFVVLLILGSFRTVSKGITMYRTEMNTAKIMKACKIDETPISAGIAGIQQAAIYVAEYSPGSCLKHKADDGEFGKSLLKGDEKLSTYQSSDSSMRSGDETLTDILERERHFSLARQGIIMICYIGIVAASIGGAAVACGGLVYWFFLVIEVPWVIAFGVATAVHLFRQHCLKVAVSYIFTEGDVYWTKRTVVIFPVACAGAGMIAGLFGVGGGIVTGPLMIEMGVLPEVASATTALMVLYSSAAATAKFAVFNMIAWDWALLLFALAFVITAISQVVILGFVRKSGRQSVIILCIGATICVGAVLMTYQAIKTTIQHAGESFEVHVCN